MFLNKIQNTIHGKFIIYSSIQGGKTTGFLLGFWIEKSGEENRVVWLRLYIEHLWRPRFLISSFPPMIVCLLFISTVLNIHFPFPVKIPSVFIQWLKKYPVFFNGILNGVLVWNGCVLFLRILLLNGVKSRTMRRISMHFTKQYKQLLSTSVVNLNTKLTCCNR